MLSAGSVHSAASGSLPGGARSSSRSPLLLGGNDEGSGGSCPLHRVLDIPTGPGQAVDASSNYEPLL